MIFGIGVDVLQQERITRTYRRFGEHFVARLLLPAERAQLGRTARPERFLAMRFAAKEAVVKALGTGFAHGVWIRDIGIVQNEWGRPEVVYSARGERLRRKLGVGDGHVTLTDEAGLIVAVAVLMKAAPRRRRRRAPHSPAPAQRRKGRR
ncbi:MAG TPA: holo-ACP synthase [Steroidobacteraceae bacterium]|nr:holo-ACP synthase [Steroidobacteraceae bacterium]